MAFVIHDKGLAIAGSFIIEASLCSIVQVLKNSMPTTWLILNNRCIGLIYSIRTYTIFIALWIL